MVTVLGRHVRSQTLAAITEALGRLGTEVREVRKIADYPLTGIRIHVTAKSHAVGDDELRAALTAVAAHERIDVAIESARRAAVARKLVMFDVDSTLVQGEVIEMLAERAGVEDQVREITQAAMRGELDFSRSLEQRVALLAGLDVSALDEVATSIVLTPGARTTVRTLRQLGYRCGVVTGGFIDVIDGLTRQLEFDYVQANNLEIVDGALTGRVIGKIVDRPAKAEALRDFAEKFGISMDQTVAVGDGANDIDMLNAAGLGIAFNAKPALRAAADVSLSFPYLDTVLLIMGISSGNVPAAQAAG